MHLDVENNNDYASLLAQRNSFSDLYDPRPSSEVKAVNFTVILGYYIPSPVISHAVPCDSIPPDFQI